MTKKREAVTRWSDIPLNSDRFLDEEARKEYDRIKNMRPIYERGFLFDWELGTPLMLSVSNLCGDHGWSDWAEHKYTHVNHHWVVEFYANKKVNAKTVWVRGKEVPVDAATIAEVLHLPVQEGAACSFKTTIMYPELYEELAADLCPEGIEWSTKVKAVNTPVDRLLTRTSLGQEARIWQAFICASVIPTQNLSTVNYGMICLLTCILRRQYVDLAALIADVFQTPADRQIKSFMFPMLITELCKKADVPEFLEDYKAKGDAAAFSAKTLVKFEGPSIFTFWKGLKDGSVTLPPIPPFGEPAGRKKEAVAKPI